MSTLSRYASPLKMSREVHNALQVTQGHNEICKRRRAEEEEEEGGKPCGTEVQKQTQILRNMKKRAASSSHLIDPPPESSRYITLWCPTTGGNNENWLLSVSCGQIWKNREWNSMKSRFSPAAATPMTSDDMRWHMALLVAVIPVTPPVCTCGLWQRL